MPILGLETYVTTLATNFRYTFSTPVDAFNMLHTLAVASFLGILGAFVVIWIEKQQSYSLRNSSAIMGGVEPTDVSRKQAIWELEPVSNVVTIESIKLLKAQEGIQSETIKLSDLWNSAQELNCLAQKFEQVAQKVEIVWNDLSLEERDKLKELAYQFAERDTIEDSKPGGNRLLKMLFANPVEFFRDLASVVSLARKHKYRLVKVASGYSKAKKRLEAAQYQFIDNILNAVEYSDPQRQQFLSDTLEELKETIAHLPDEQLVKPEKISGWLPGLSESDMDKF